MLFQNNLYFDSFQPLYIYCHNGTDLIGVSVDKHCHQ